MDKNVFACVTWYLGVEIATGLRLRAPKQSDAVVVLLATRSAALSQILPILQGQQVVAHPTWDEITAGLILCVYGFRPVLIHISELPPL